MKKTIAFLFFCSLILATACTPKNIQGTDIPDNEENRAVINVFKEYTEAVQSKNPEKILATVAEEYYDTNGTEKGEDDVDYKALKAFLQTEDFKKILEINVIFIIKQLTLTDESAKLLFYFETRYKQEDTEKRKSILNQTNEKWTKMSDVNLMTLKKINGKWKIVSGI